MVLAEGAACLLAARLALLVRPFRRVAPLMGQTSQESPETLGASALDQARDIGWALTRLPQALGIEDICLVQALAGKFMLKRRGIPSTIYLGLAKEEDGGLKAHAWLRAGERILTGGQGRGRFTVVAVFGDPAGPGPAEDNANGDLHPGP